jgi:signal transduction histidine kinase
VPTSYDDDKLDRGNDLLAAANRMAGLLDAVVDMGSDAELGLLLDRIVAAACGLVNARYGALGVVGPEGELVEFHTFGLTEAQREAIGALPCGRGILGLLIEKPVPIRMTDLSAHPDSYGFPANHPPMRIFLGVPIRVGDRIFGNLYLTEKLGAPQFSAADEESMVALAAAAGATIAGLAAFAAERKRAEVDRAKLAVLKDRDRIARDLHDVVIQRLFATGLQLQNVIYLTERPEVAERVNTAVDEIDAAMKDIRTAIFQLHDSGGGDIRTQVQGIASNAETSLRFRPRVSFIGPVDTVIDNRVRVELLAVLKEALTNVARHAGASQVDITLQADREGVELTVRDDGRGIEPDISRGGLHNLAARAADLAGSFTAARTEPSGTEVVWTVPHR